MPSELKFNTKLTFKCIIMGAWVAPLVAGIGAIGDAISGYGAYKSQQSANRSNELIASQNREWQSQENASQREWEERMWNANNEYNTPLNQLRRYRDAGINPYLSASAQLGSTSTAPSAPPMVAAPNMPDIRPNFRGVDVFGKAMSFLDMDAAVANQNSQALTNVADALRQLYDMFGEDKALEICKPLISQISGASFNGHNFARRALAGVKADEASAGLQEIELDIQKEYGKQRASEVVSNMQMDFTKKVAECGLWSSLADLNRARERSEGKLIKVYEAECQEKLAHAFELFSQGNYIQSLKLTEDQKRDYFIKLLRNEAAASDMELVDRYADFDSDSGVRALKHSDKFKGVKEYNYSLDNNPLKKTVDAATGSITPVVNSLIQASPKLSAPPRLRQYEKVRRNGMTPNGYKEWHEWYREY